MSASQTSADANPAAAGAVGAAAQASAMAMAAAQTNPAALDPYGAGDETARDVLQSVFITTVVLIVVNTLFLVLRFFTVLKLRKRRIPLAWDDWFLLMAWPWVIGVCAVALVMWHYEVQDGALAHEPIVQPWRLEALLKSTIALAEIGLPAMILTRYSVLTLYLRLFTDRFVRLVSYALIVLYSMYWAGYAVAGILQCRPVSYYWTRWNPMHTGTCFDIKFSRSVSPPNIAFDIIMIVLPLHFIWKLRLSVMRKLGLTCIIFTAVVAFVVTVVRTVILSKNTNELEAPVFTKDFLLWMVLEPSLYFITACLPAMLPLFRLFVPGSLRRHRHRPVGPITPISNHSMRYNGTATSASDRGFLRLRDDTTPQPSSYANGGRESKMSDISVHEMENNLQMEDLKKFTSGQGIIVQTDVTVTWTTEERIEEILDLW